MLKLFNETYDEGAIKKKLEHKELDYDLYSK